MTDLIPFVLTPHDHDIAILIRLAIERIARERKDPPKECTCPGK